MNYNLNELSKQQEKVSAYKALKKLFRMMEDEQRNLYIAGIATVINSGLLLLGPLLIGYTIDTYVRTKQYNGVLLYCGILLAVYLVAFATGYVQTQLMGRVGQRLLFTLRNALFNKLQLLPVDFFNQNKAGDLISRINNDTDKINQFFSQSLIQFVRSLMSMVGAATFLLLINYRLGSAALVPAVVIFIFTRIISAWIKRKNAIQLKSTGGMSGEIQESLNNFRVIIAFNRRDYFRKRFDEVNVENYTTAIKAGLANNILLPVYSFFAGMAQLTVLVYGIYLITQGLFTVGLLVSYFSYAVSFYNPLQQMATLWSTFQLAMAAWDRISQILSMESDLVTVASEAKDPSDCLVTFDDVSFGYTADKEILHHISLKMERGKTYALVGPTGGGKTTTASLIARLYDPTSGVIMLAGKDIRSYTAEERSQKIGFILQEPFLFTGTVKDNILYGNAKYAHYTNEQLEDAIKAANLESLLSIFDGGLNAVVTGGGESISLGQKQLIAFMRAVLRDPELLILDEATANIDTITEQLLGDILKKLPEKTTRVIIAHRLNTIENADEIFFVNSGNVIRAGSFNDAMELLLKGKRVS